MRFFTLASLSLAMLCGCGDTSTQPGTYEANKPVLDESPSTGTMDPAMDPSATSSPNDNAQMNSDPTVNEDTAVNTPTNPSLDPVNSSPIEAENELNEDAAEQIRTQISDADLTTAADDVEVTSDDGKITLKGTVANQAEKDRIEEIAKQQAGEENVTSELEIKE